MSDFRHPDEAWLRDWFRDVKHIAVVGLSPKANRPSHIVAKKMQAFGYHIIPVRPAVATVLGEPAYADLADVPGPVDAVCVFRAPDRIESVVDVCIARQIPVLWLQEGVVNQVVAERAAAAGIRVIMDRCLLKDYLRVLG